MINQTFTNGYALFIGISADLPVTVKDATAIRNILIGGEHCNHKTYVNIQLFGAWKSGFPHLENKENRDIQLIGVCLYYFKFL
ncbi:hypothetical protein GTQ43_23830 [Nostoc sp. KVJ3]|uniref:hypothetical protein n=1 Tax=Nostoc sp. KVJ3 TaxID=457945 RepID=UPI0022391060|nr:hypothetical protein [Nostoc sp. KVJ3]MCW5316734.1 hypothetical protein [Nostoc sp. KVJ3]